MSETLQRPQRGLGRIDWEDDGTTEFQMGHGEWVKVLRGNGFEILDLAELYADENTTQARLLRIRSRVGPPLAVGRDLART